LGGGVIIVSGAAPVPVVLDVVGESVECTVDHPCGSVGMPAGSAAVDQADQPADFPDAGVVHPVMGEFVEQMCQLGQPSAAGAALARAFFRQVVGNRRCASQSTFVRSHSVDDARA
jgi:hypothetical protein